MKKFRLALLAATAATLVTAGAANAQVVPTNNNKVYLNQAGQANSASIDQNGGDNNRVGQTTNDAKQFNDLDPASNTLTITQEKNNNEVDALLQNAEDGAGTNNLTITQTNTTAGSATGQNVISTVSQKVSTGSTAHNEATLTQDGVQNRLSVSQNQTGADNNVIKFTANGDRNGNQVFSTGGYAEAAGLAGATSSSLTQDGSNNLIDLTINGDDNRFGINQQGSQNTLNVLTVTGGSNELGIFQDSRTSAGSNNLQITGIVGNSNNIGVIQSGGGAVNGTITLGSLGSNSNKILLQQSQDATANITITNGNSNDIAVSQSDGGTTDINLTDITVEGDSNLLNVDQFAGSGNTVTVNITGNSNNAGGFLESPTSTLANANNLFSGDLIQKGTGNTATWTIGSNSNPGANLNQFAMLQSGDNNQVTAKVDGVSNEAVVIQNGDGNISNVTQYGVGNISDVNQ